jgi:hypothetical protein
MIDRIIDGQVYYDNGRIWESDFAARIFKGGTRKIADLPKVCCDPYHNPPTHMFYEDGVWEHTCPSCGKTKTFTVRNPSM